METSSPSLHSALRALARLGGVSPLLLQGIEVVNRVPYLFLGHLATKGGHGRAGDPIADGLEQIMVRMERHMQD